jgi:hypothetical protein
MANVRRVLMLLLCASVATLASAGDKERKQEKKESSADKKARRSESSHYKKDEAADAKRERSAERHWEKDSRTESRHFQKDAAAEAKWARAADRRWDRRMRAIKQKEYFAARHGYHYFSHDVFLGYHDYYVQTYGYACPPGLVPGYGGCFWPGYHRRRYVIGEVLPYDVAYLPPPPELIGFVGPPPPGYAYVMVDGDLVELLAGTRMVVDAIEGFLED